MEIAHGNCPILASMKLGLVNWRNRFDLDNDNAFDLTPFCDAVIAGIKSQISHLPSLTDKEPNDLDKLLKAVRQARKRFVISYVDKFSSKFMFTCPKFYAQSLLNEFMP